VALLTALAAARRVDKGQWVVVSASGTIEEENEDEEEEG
jgi:hypothetical protein